MMRKSALLLLLLFIACAPTTEHTDQLPIDDVVAALQCDRTGQ